jgi:xylan 1,4-beta-xylosidase
MRNQLFLFIFIFSSVCFAQKGAAGKEIKTGTASKEFKYTNPMTRDSILSMRDYMIVKSGGKWYATGTSNPVWKE